MARSGAYNLKLDAESVDFKRLDFLRSQVRIQPFSSSGERTKSTPMVEMNESVNVSSAKRNNKHDLPTPESPMIRILKR